MVDNDTKRPRTKASEKNIKLMRIASKPKAVDLIGERLRQYYDEVAVQPVPDRFLSLLDQLDNAVAAKKSK